jgi:hypothetical protein
MDSSNQRAGERKMKFWSNDIQCFREYQNLRGHVEPLDECDRPYNMSRAGEDFDDTIPIYGAQVHLTRPLSDQEFFILRSIESMFDYDGNFPEEGQEWNSEEHQCWLNFDYFSQAARDYLESIPD